MTDLTKDHTQSSTRSGRRPMRLRPSLGRVGTFVIVAVMAALGLHAVPSAAASLSAAASGDEPIGHLDGPSIRMNRDPRFLPEASDAWTYELYGWAVDPNAPDQPVTIHLYLNGEFAGEDVTGNLRTDVAAAYPWSGPNTGFSAPVGSSGAGPQTLCAYAINLGAGSTNTTLGCVDLPVPRADGHEPLGNIDEMRVAPGMIHMSGWAGDSDVRDETVEVRVYYDDTHVLTIQGNQPRPDVVGVFPELDDTTGFSHDLPIQPGVHHVCAYAGNLGRGGLYNTTLGCRVLDIPNVSPPGPLDPQGHVDTTRNTFEGTGLSRNFVAGWAFDPDTSGPWTVRVLSAYNPGFGGRKDPVVVTVGTTGQPRPDVQSMFPAAGSSSGYELELDLLGKYGKYTFSCAYARQDGTGAGTERFLGCINW